VANALQTLRERCAAVAKVRLWHKGKGFLSVCKQNDAILIIIAIRGV